MNTPASVFAALLAAACVGAALAAPLDEQAGPDGPAGPAPKPIAILKLASDRSPDGAFSYEYETENGIKADARGVLNNAGSENEALAQQGSYSFVAPDGVTYSVQWIADENGFQPQGAHLPTPPPIPEDILRSLEYNAAHPDEDEEKNKD